MKYEGSVRKLYQLSREIEEMPGGTTRDNLQHSVHKLMSFLYDEVPGWKDDVAEYQEENPASQS